MSVVYLAAMVTWTVVPALQYGYHTSALNQVQAVMSCSGTSPSPGHLQLPSCIPMDDARFGILTSSFTVGGLLGSMMAGVLSERLGRKGASLVSALLTSLGATGMAASPSYYALVACRFLVGIAAGIALCVVPVMLSEIAPSTIRGSIGTLNQLAIVMGVLVTQCIGLGLAAPTFWRYVLVISAGVSVVQLLLSPLIYDTPAWLDDNGRKDEAETAARLLWGVPDVTLGQEEGDDDGVEAPLLRDTPADTVDGPHHSLSTWELLKNKELRLPLWITILCFIAQQGSGINAVMYYSSNILAGVLPELAGYISVVIAVINAVMTFPPVFLIDRVGKRPILLASIVGTVLSVALVTVGLDTGHSVVAGVGIVGFVATFAAGLGPIPFVITAQIAPYHAVSALSSIALSLQWIINFLVAVGFLPLRNALSFGKGLEGNVFIVFTVILVVSGSLLARLYHEST